jgi:hypothetical protein
MLALRCRLPGTHCRHLVGMSADWEAAGPDCDLPVAAPESCTWFRYTQSKP